MIMKKSLLLLFILTLIGCVQGVERFQRAQYMADIEKSQLEQAENEVNAAKEDFIAAEREFNAAKTPRDRNTAERKRNIAIKNLRVSEEKLGRADYKLRSANANFRLERKEILKNVPEAKLRAVSSKLIAASEAAKVIASIHLSGDEKRGTWRSDVRRTWRTDSWRLTAEAFRLAADKFGKNTADAFGLAAGKFKILAEIYSKPKEESEAKLFREVEEAFRTFTAEAFRLVADKFTVEAQGYNTAEEESVAKETFFRTAADAFNSMQNLMNELNKDTKSQTKI